MRFSRVRRPAGVWLGAMIVAALSGCMLGPDYRPPDIGTMNLPSEWTSTGTTGDQGDQLVGWWKQFDDGDMVDLIEAAERSSPTLAIALARVKGAGAAVEQKNSGLFPALNGQLAGSRSNFDEFVDESPSISDVGQETRGEANRTSYGLNASWELDLFGAIRRGVQAGDAQLASQQALFEEARIVLAADVAKAYVDYRECESMTVYLSQGLQTSKNIGHLVALKAKSGFAAPLDAQFAAGNVASSREQLVTKHAQCSTVFDQIVYLTGFDRKRLQTLLTAGAGRVPTIDPTRAPVTVTAALVAQRPDVRAAERTLAATSAKIGVAIAQRFPSVSATGSLSQTDYYALGQVLSLSPWTLGGSLVLPLFDAGAGAARVSAARAQYEEALATYTQQVRLATREIENALALTQASAQRVAAAQLAVANYTGYFRASEMSHDAGALSLIDLESARQRLVGSQQDAIAAESGSAHAWISLYAALGGGWPAPTSMQAQTVGGGIR
ncbi:efflux transporter outer membrane subunit [Caballeronia sp. dw_276]|uniref:efflux transporter outer membrane subunit n=1 Tax=Caballeronia sp. dw_276 TaxID=2719795 RepID=UPI001BD6D9B1|nr:efflux transporter outer membrane subunit [Caballeronia sp. dw_276]